ncbi:phosphotransferase enzyme family protein [Bacillus sp. NTK034]|uniref:phosphotransferase enzyme family protein n=1 Tax=Bacillus sp. NTK034 TaxID=2802176 RepID=UPI001A8E225B|nr:phosphotransferase [Bacillus sp. NTK034]MBN8199352.1 phosphotransferase [Bacillus sp. NTK034]
MENAVDALMTDDILKNFLRIYSLNIGNYKKLGDFENYVYEVHKDGIVYILRITHSSHRMLEELLSEADWMNYLKSKDLKVSEVFPSQNGNMVERLTAEDGSAFYASLFSKAEGKPISVRAREFNQELFQAWGRAVGKMHAATKSYVPSAGILPRMQWDEEELLLVEKYIPAEDQLVIKHTKDLLNLLQNLPKNINSFGLIHTDLHSGNFFYDGKDIHVFDFDDCCHHWFASDIAIPLYYSLLYKFKEADTAEMKIFGKHFLDAFLVGYQLENEIPDGLERQLPLFLRLRDITLYSVLHKKIAPEDRNSQLLFMMETIKKRIERNDPIYPI